VLANVPAEGLALRLDADAPPRGRAGRRLGLLALHALSAELGCAGAGGLHRRPRPACAPR
jgi:hypothetical protein